MKKILGVLMVLVLFSMDIVSAKSSVSISPSDKEFKIYPSTDSSSYKIYYQFVKVSNDKLKVKEDLQRQLKNLEGDYLIQKMNMLMHLIQRIQQLKIFPVRNLLKQVQK